MSDESRCECGRRADLNGGCPVHGNVLLVRWESERRRSMTAEQVYAREVLCTRYDADPIR